MATHVSEARLLEFLEGKGGADRAHVESCARCGARLAEARSGLALARDADMPEPSPFYWESLRRQVNGRLDASSERIPLWQRRRLGFVLAAAAAIAAIATLLPVAAPPPDARPERPLPAWSALPPAEDDPGLDVLRALGPAVAEVAPAACAGMAECVVQLSEEESEALAERLRGELAAGKDL